MAEPVQKLKENIIIWTMQDDLSGKPKPTLTPNGIELLPPIKPFSKEAQFEAPKTTDKLPKITPISPPTPEKIKAPAAPLDYHSVLPPLPEIKAKPAKPESETKPAVLIVPPKPIPPKKFPELPIKPLYKATPVWIKFGMIGLAVAFLVFAGLFGYWKYFIRGESLPAIFSTATTTVATLPEAPTATTTAPIKFFNKLPNKSITIDLPAKTSTALTKALKSEAKIEETRSSVKQIKITYQGQPLTAEEFLGLMSIFTPKDFLLNYENEFALAFFSQAEGARPVLMLKAKNKDLTKTQMVNWEKSTLPNDILPLFLDNLKLPKSLPAFKDYLFVGQPVSYLNIGANFASLNYTIYNDFLIFTTSSAGMFVILQDLTGQGISQSYLENLKASIDTFVK